MDHFLRVSFKYKENPFEYDQEIINIPDHFLIYVYQKWSGNIFDNYYYFSFLLLLFIFSLFLH